MLVLAVLFLNNANLLFRSFRILLNGKTNLFFYMRSLSTSHPFFLTQVTVLTHSPTNVALKEITTGC